MCKGFDKDRQSETISGSFDSHKKNSTMGFMHSAITHQVILKSSLVKGMNQRNSTSKILEFRALGPQGQFHGQVYS